MRVLLANKFFYRRGGAEALFFDMDRLLRDAGHETIHFSQQDARNEHSEWSHFFLPAVRPSARAALRALGIGVRRAVRRLVRAARPDVALLHNVYHELGRPALVDELVACGVPMVQYLHDYKVVCPAYTLRRDGQPCEKCADGRFRRAARYACGGSRARSVVMALESHAMRGERDAAIVRYLAPSRFLAEKVREMGFAPEVALLRPPVEPQPIARGDAIGFAGRLAEEKGVFVLAEAARALPELEFRVAGTGPAAPDWPSNVTLLGHLDAAALHAERRRWRTVAVPSLWYENCPLSVLEAFAAGLPVVGSDLGGLRELLLAGGGRAVRPADAGALAEALHTPGTDGAAGRAFIERECSPAAFTARLEATLREVTA